MESERYFVDFPDDLDGRANVVLNVANSELKVATLLSLDDSLITAEDVRGRVRENIRNRVKLPRTDSFEAYLEQTLVPLGMASREVLGGFGKACYALTYAGRKYGFPILSFSLQYSEQRKRSMYSILGKTGSSGESRSPLNRVKILDALRNNHNSLEKVVEIVGLGETGVTGHLEHLKNIGFVDYDKFRIPNNSKFYFEWVKEKDFSQIKPVDDYRLLTIEAAKKLKELGVSDALGLNEILGKSILSVMIVLNALAQQGFVIKKGYGNSSFSNIRLLGKGREFLEGYWDKIKDALSGGLLLSEMEDSHKRLIEDSERFADCLADTIERYLDVSYARNKRKGSEIRERIIFLLKSHPEGLRNFEIANKLKIKSPCVYLTPMIVDEIIRKEKHAGIPRYFLNKKL